MITASKLELAKKCPAAFALPHTHERTAETDAGNERHQQREDDINAGRIPAMLAERWPDLEWRAEVAYAYDVVTGQARELGQGIKRDYSGAKPTEICGTADMVGYGRGKLVIGDKKSFDPNVSRAAQNGQLHILALAAARTYGLTDAEVFIEHEVRGLDVAVLDALDLDAFADEVRDIWTSVEVARKQNRDGVAKFSPGTHCRWCPAFHACPKQQALALEVRSGAAEKRVEFLVPLHSDEAAADAYEFAQNIRMLLKRLDSALYARAKERPFQLKNGKMFGLVEKLGNREIDGDRAYALLRERYGQQVADAAVSREATQKGIEDALKKAGVPTPTKAKDEVIKALEAAGGVTRKKKVEIDEFVPQLAQGVK